MVQEPLKIARSGKRHLKMDQIYLLIIVINWIVTTMKVRDLMSYPIATVTPEATVLEARSSTRYFPKAGTRQRLLSGRL